LQSYEEALKRLPNSSLVFEQMAHVERRLGQWDLAEKHYQAAAQLDPRNLEVLSNLPELYQSLRRFRDAEAATDQMLQLLPGSETWLGRKASLFQAEGRLGESASELSKIDPNSHDEHVVLTRTFQFAYERRFDDAITLLKQPFAREIAEDPRAITYLGYLQEWSGRTSDARAAFERAIATMKPSSASVVPVDARNLPSFLAQAYAGLGEKEKALEQARRAVADYEGDVLDKPFAEIVVAQIQARFGELDSAFAALPHLLEVPGGLTRGQLRIDPFWDPLRKDPRFQKLCEEKQP
jgi:tetratricopeptide (TPR) repeat protein